MPKAKTALTNKEKKKRCAVKFFKKYKVGYDAFRNWLKNHHYLSITHLFSDEEIKKYVDMYKNDVTSFKDTYGILYGSFRNWFESNYDMMMGDLTIEEKEPYIGEYLFYRLMKPYSRVQIANVAAKYVIAIEEGLNEIDIPVETDEQVRIINILLNKNNPKALAEFLK